jgi:hypothetical protein
MQEPACGFSRRLLLRLSGRWAESFTILALDDQSVKRERFLAAKLAPCRALLGSLSEVQDSLSRLYGELGEEGPEQITDYFRFLRGTNRLVLSQRAKKRRRRVTWAGTEIDNEAKAAEAKVEAKVEAKAAVDETKGATGSEAVAWGIVRALLKKG